jgi:3-deoxy-manno-octulosonate cytidylyltransferase (CMP-KDO synthetase)
MSIKTHESGSDRIAEAIEHLDIDIVVNIQGDEPFVKRAPLEKVLDCFKDPSVEVASLMQVLENPASIADPNYVKVAVDKKMNALFFSRSVIPFLRDTAVAPTYYEHVGVYAFKKQALIDFTNWPMSPLEAAEKIECLRYLENGVGIRMAITDYMGVEIDTPEDLIKAAQLLNK